MRYEHSSGAVTEAVLLSYKRSGPSDDYRPLRIGDRWTYAWKNDYREEAVIETCIVSDQPQDLKIDSKPRSEPSLGLR